MPEADVKKYIENLEDLSTIPVMLGKLLAVVWDENATAVELYKVISFDQALAQRILRVANSAAFGRSGDIKDIDQAILFLGFEKIKNIALGMTVMSTFTRKGAFNMTNLWIHSYEVGFLASALSDMIPMTLPGECFLGGLLHDVGRIVLVGMDPVKFNQITTTDTMMDQEIGFFGSTHAYAGSLFAEKLKFPGDLSSIIRYHHQPSLAKQQRGTTCAVALAEALSRRFSPRVEDDGIWTSEHDTILKEFSISQEDIDNLGNRLIKAAPEIESFFH